MSQLLEGRRLPLDLVCVIALAFAGMLSTLLPEGNIARLLLGTVYVLLLPGYALVSALWPEGGDAATGAAEEPPADKGQGQPAGRPGPSLYERLLLGIGLSLVILPVIGIVLDSQWSIDSGPVATSLFGFTVAFALLAVARRQRLPEETRFRVSLASLLARDGAETTRLDRALSWALAISLVLAACAVAYLMSTPKSEEPHTELYLLDQNRTLAALPAQLQVNETGTIIAGLTCREAGPTDYTLIVSLQNSTGERQNRTLSMENLTLAVDENREFAHDFSVAEEGRYKLEAALFKAGEAAPSQEVHLWIDVGSP
jgi:uncharacterized membrane protein